MTMWPIKAAPVNARIARRFQFGHPRRRVTEQWRSLANKMKTLALLLVLGLVLSACSESPFSRRGFVPIHSNLQIAIDNAGHGGGCTVEPQLKDTKFDADSHVTFTCTRRDG